MMDLRQIQATSHKIAADHGFWSTEEDRNIPSKIALIHAEASEALEEYRQGRMALWYEYKGPKTGQQAEVFRSGPDGKIYLVHGLPGSPEYSEVLMTHDRWLELGYEAKPEGFGIELADAIIRIGDLAEYLGIDLEEMVRIKFEYNLTRPFKHGRRV